MVLVYDLYHQLPIATRHWEIQQKYVNWYVCLGTYVKQCPNIVDNKK